jgi:hypothetical protein
MARFLDRGLMHEKWYRVFNTEDAAQLLLRAAQEAIQDNYTRL